MSITNDLRSVCFDIQHPHYLTQFLPVYRELERRRITGEFLFHANEGNIKFIRRLIRKEGIQAQIITSDQQAIAYHHLNRPTWIFFGNECRYLSKLPKPRRTCKTAQLYHEVGVKNEIYNPASMAMSVRLVEGPYYARELRKRFPDKRMVEVGYPKLDPQFGPEMERPFINLEELSLSHEKKTLLYTPSFHPSSIGKMPEEWPEDFHHFNIIIKPHPFLYSQERFESERKKLREWAEFENVHVTSQSEISALPYMAAADILLGDAASELFEFASLDKPLVWLDFYTLGWGYRGPLKYRLRKQLDERIFQYANMCPHAASYAELSTIIERQLTLPEEYSRRRKGYSREIIGKTDGKVSERIVDYIFPETKGMSIPALPSPGVGNAGSFGY